MLRRQQTQRWHIPPQMNSSATNQIPATNESTVVAGLFPQTKWSLVIRAQGLDGVTAQKALGELLQLYWSPLYVLARQSGLQAADAEDTVQGFCETLISRGSLKRADPGAGRLRSFLLTSFRNHMCDQHRHATRSKRGGGAVIISMDGAEESINLAISKSDSPDLAFERQWAYTLLAHALQRLRQEYEKRDRAMIFEYLEPALAWNGSDISYANVAVKLNTSVAAVQQQVKRMRARFRKLIEEEIQQTVCDPTEVEIEREYFIRILSEN